MKIEMPKKLETLFLGLENQLGKTKEEMIMEALRQYIEDQLDAIDAEAAYSEWIKDGRKTYSMDEVMKECGIDESDLDA